MYIHVYAYGNVHDVHAHVHAHAHVGTRAPDNEDTHLYQ